MYFRDLDRCSSKYNILRDLTHVAPEFFSDITQTRSKWVWLKSEKNHLLSITVSISADLIKTMSILVSTKKIKNLGSPGRTLTYTSRPSTV